MPAEKLNPLRRGPSDAPFQMASCNCDGKVFSRFLVNNMRVIQNFTLDPRLRLSRLNDAAMRGPQKLMLKIVWPTSNVC